MPEAKKPNPTQTVLQPDHGLMHWKTINSTKRNDITSPGVWIRKLTSGST